MNARDERAATRLGFAAALGLVAVLLGAFDLARWGDWLLEINPVGESQSLANGVITGRALIAIGAMLVTLATSAGAGLASTWALRGASAVAVFVGVASLLAHVALLGTFWTRGFYYLLEPTLPKLVLALSLVQSLALVVIGAQHAGAQPRAHDGRRAAE